MKKNEDKRTEQEKDPHASLVEVRNSIAAAYPEHGRPQHASIANQLSHKQCDAVVAADGDVSKIRDAVGEVEAVVFEGLSDKTKAEIQKRRAEKAKSGKSSKKTADTQSA